MGRRLASLVAGAAVIASLVAAAGAQAVLTNDSVLRLMAAGVPDHVIVAEIEGAPTQFDVSPDALAALVAGGVSPRVLDAMGRAAGRAEAPPAAPAPAAADVAWLRLGLRIGAPVPAPVPTLAAAVADLRPRGPAASVGVERGDLITHVNGERVVSAAHALAALERATAAHSTVLDLLRRAQAVRIVVPATHDGDIAFPPSAVTAGTGREMSPILSLIGRGRAAPPPGPPPATVPVELELRFAPGDVSVGTIASIALVADGVTVRETRPLIDGHTARATFAGPDGEVAPGRTYAVEITSVLGRRVVATLDLRTTTAPLARTIDVLEPASPEARR